MPLFQGGAVNSRRKQAYSQYNQADENTLFTERRIIQEVRSQFSNVNTLVANVTAQTQAVISATSALEATQVGYKVGTRNIVDLLQAEKNLYSAEKNLANAKYDYILANLRLALAAGTIDPSNIVEINNATDVSQYTNKFLEGCVNQIQNLKEKRKDWKLQYGCITQNGRLVCGNRYK